MVILDVEEHGETQNGLWHERLILSIEQPTKQLPRRVQSPNTDVIDMLESQ